MAHLCDVIIAGHMVLPESRVLLWCKRRVHTWITRELDYCTTLLRYVCCFIILFQIWSKQDSGARRDVLRKSANFCTNLLHSQLGKSLYRSHFKPGKETFLGFSLIRTSTLDYFVFKGCSFLRTFDWHAESRSTNSLPERWFYLQFGFSFRSELLYDSRCWNMLMTHRL